MLSKKFSGLIACSAIILSACSKQDVIKPHDLATPYDITEDFSVTASGDRFLSKVLYEDYTGAWCGWCPRLAYKFDLMMEHNPNRFIVQGNHNGDAFTTSYQSNLERTFKVTGFPTGWENRTQKFKDNGNIMNLSDTIGYLNYLKTLDSVGLSITSSLNGNQVSGTVKVGFGYTFSPKLKLVIELLEDSLVLDQSSYYNTSPVGNPYYGLGSKIKGFVHRNTLRKCFTNELGNLIPATSTTAGSEYSLAYNFDISGYKASQCKVVAFVVYETGQSQSGIINVQWTKAGVDKGFDRTRKRTHK
jgi:hypothetical protein